MAKAATTFLAAGLLFVAMTATGAQNSAAPQQSALPPPSPSDNISSPPDVGVSIHPYVANALDRRDVSRSVEMGAPGGDTYVEHVPRAFGLTLHSPF